MPDTYWDLFYAYTALWLIVVFFVVSLMGRQKNLHKQILELEERIERYNGRA